MRLINADAIEYTHAIARSLDDGHNWNELCVTKDEIEDMPTIHPEPHWIPVTERLPDISKSVLICDIEDDIYLGHRTRYGDYYPDFYDDRIKNVTAWMPLPEPMRLENK